MEELMIPTSPLNQQESNPPSSTDEFAEPTPPAPAPEKLTRKQLGQLRRQYITIVNGTVKACGHKDNFSKNERREGKPPNNNCVDAGKLISSPVSILDFVHAVLTTKGAPALIAMKGTKFTRMFHGFLSSKMLPMLAAEVNAAHKEAEDATGAPAMIQGGTFGNGTARNEVQATSVAQ